MLEILGVVLLIILAGVFVVVLSTMFPTREVLVQMARDKGYHAYINNDGNVRISNVGVYEVEKQFYIAKSRCVYTYGGVTIYY